ncbi:hypothetical protein FOA43_003404 [Brettanomyces nanus]|uniref:Ribosomal protein L9 domain-containing protein n=1 Tax=Eeniella nana TaxID=13502 RepID=A0A875S4Y3_EENNA|nr:uncharacterized protein FOA43_003404 [Brettanomyces nanus]QPG76018.1 hypothetical protein FOA43_003404 [Brettanomyces nanus]
MFSRSPSFVYSCIKSETPKIGVRYTAQSKKKRIVVQLLKDFAGVGVKGQVVHVKASTMINRLHPFNGAAYLNYSGAEPVIPVVQPKKSEPPKADANLSTEEANATKATSEIESNKRHSSEELLSLDQLVSIDLTELVGTDKDVILSKIPKKLIFYRDTVDDELRKPLSPDKIIDTLKNVATKELKEQRLKSSAIQFFQNHSILFLIKAVGEDGKPTEKVIDQIKALGTYHISLQENGEELASTIISVGSRNEK